MKRKLGMLVNTLKAMYHAAFIKRDPWHTMVVDNYFPVYVNKRGDILYCRPDWMEELYDDMVNS